MEGLDREAMRTRWGSMMRDARAGEATYVFLNRATPWGVLMAKDIWDVGFQEEPVPEQSCELWTPKELRQSTGKARLHVERGKHLLLHSYTGLRTKTDQEPVVEIVVAPYAWTRRALKALGEVVIPGSATQRYRGESDPSAES
ncbi:hypothetical protein [Nocardia tengchongensis]|uniref:hypothetical protein n=1 Tax=Nocardia tengchongensis TaxID=2055889 RepID=UPI003657956C